MHEKLSFIDNILYYQTYFPRQECLVVDEEIKQCIRSKLANRAVSLFSNSLSPYLKKRIEEPYFAAGYEVLGAGFHATTYRREGDSNVRKLHRTSAYLDDEAQSALVETYRERQTIVESYLGNYAVHQLFSSQAHPLHPERSAVIAEQPYVDFTPLVQYQDTATENMRTQIEDFVDRSEQMVLDTGYIVDVGGANNIVVMDDNLLLLDTLPCDPKYATRRTAYCALQRVEELRTIVEN